jgi:hypothetical protein
MSLDGKRAFGKMWVLICARADNAAPVRKWFAVERDPRIESGYRTQREDPPEDVLKAAPSP